MMLDVPTLVGWVTIIGAIVSLGLWLRNETKDISKDANERLIHSDAFEARVSKIMSAALTGIMDPLVKAITDLEGRHRDAMRRIGELERDMAAVKGRIQSTRSTDGEKGILP